jgi:sec-independent protein translocase protein TatC
MSELMATEDREEFREMELWEHLAELRGRLMRSVLYVLLGLSLAWFIYPPLEAVFKAPIQPIMDARGWKWVFRTFTQAFMLRLQVSAIAGLVLAIPLVTLEIWGFIAPGLTRSERKACYVVFPLSLFFFFMGVACGYLLMNTTVSYFAQYIPADTDLLQDPLMYLTFMIKMIVAFGVSFQLPVVLMLLAWLGIVSSKTLRAHWRLAVVGCFAVAAIATPGGDPMTMVIMAAPLAVLYVGSIFLCGMVERIRARREKSESIASVQHAPGALPGEASPNA